MAWTKNKLLFKICSTYRQISIKESSWIQLILTLKHVVQTNLDLRKILGVTKIDAYFIFALKTNQELLIAWFLQKTNSKYSWSLYNIFHLFIKTFAIKHYFRYKINSSFLVKLSLDSYLQDVFNVDMENKPSCYKRVPTWHH